MVETTKHIARATVLGATGYAQDIQTGPHTLHADEHPKLGGTGIGPSPYQLLLASLGACTSITLRMYAQRKGWERGEIHVDLKFYQGEGDPGGRIERSLRFEAELSSEQEQLLFEIAWKSAVTKTLFASTSIHTEMSSSE